MDQHKIFTHTLDTKRTPPTPPSEGDLGNEDHRHDYGSSKATFWMQTESHGAIPVRNYNEKS